VRANLTLNLGVRYEYVSPLTEINNRIVNLDLSPGVLIRRCRWADAGDADPAGAIGAIQRQPAERPGATRSRQLCAAHWLRLETASQHRSAWPDMASTTTRARIRDRTATRLSAAVLHCGNQR